MAPRCWVELSESTLEAESVLHRFRSSLSASCGAVASFIGVVRGEEIEAIELDYYPVMCRAQLESLAERARTRWQQERVLIMHRVGLIGRGEVIVAAAAAGSHRGDSFSCCAFMMDWLKVSAPFWKREILVSGESRWVAARSSDERAAARWAETERAGEGKGEHAGGCP